MKKWLGNMYCYGIEVHIEDNEWYLRDDMYGESDLELAKKNCKHARKQLPDDKFRVVKFKRVGAIKNEDSNFKNE